MPSLKSQVSMTNGDRLMSSPWST